MRREKLNAILDVLLPGDRHWPSAGRLAIEDRLEADLTGLLDRIDAALTSVSVESIEALERDRPELFEPLLGALYDHYYTHPDVLKVVEERTGYPARPPQPLGYELPPFDEKLLDKVKQMKPFWRRA